MKQGFRTLVAMVIILVMASPAVLPCPSMSVSKEDAHPCCPKPESKPEKCPDAVCLLVAPPATLQTGAKLIPDWWAALETASAVAPVAESDEKVFFSPVAPGRDVLRTTCVLRI